MWQQNSNEQEPEKFYGKYPGLVLKKSPDQGTHTGEILVEVSGLLEDMPGNNGGEQRRRPMQVLAKPCFQPGFFFIPEKGAQVWIEFAAGDLNTPIWTGVWYPDGKTPLTVENQAPTASQKVIHTASGHILQFDDSDGNEVIVIVDTKHGNKITLDKDGITVVCKTMKISGDVKIDGTLTVGTGPTTTISGNEITGGEA